MPAVESAEGYHRRLHRRLDLILKSHVGARENGRLSQGLHFIDNRFSLRLEEVGDGDIPALRGDPQGDGASQPPGASRHQDGAALLWCGESQ